MSWDRQVGVRYAVYGVPGGAQVTAPIKTLGYSRRDHLTVRAVRAIRRRIAADLSAMRDNLE